MTPDCAPISKAFSFRRKWSADKPSKAFFDACFAAIPGFRLEETVMVGDSLTSDIRGGSNAGLRTVWFNPHGKEPRPDIRPNYTIHALSELLPLLASIQ
ncbi:MAG: HAD hydrolase-like protein [Dysosmobacter sp.]